MLLVPVGLCSKISPVILLISHLDLPSLSPTFTVHLKADLSLLL
jgi:hypothetical protein